MKTLRQFLIKLIDGFFAIIALDGRVVERLVNRYLFALRINSNDRYYTYHTRPKRASDVGLDVVISAAQGRIGIVIQGPVLHDSNFTLETASLYLRLFPSSYVVISTWLNEIVDNHDVLLNPRLHVVKSTPPKCSGLGTTNFQLVTTRAGIQVLESLGCEYVLKTRSDQRIYAQNLDNYLTSLLKQYPSQSEFQRCRIVELSMNICRYRPYSMCDMFQFGHISDMKDMWFAELDNRNVSTKQFSSRKRTSREISEADIGEIYLHRMYLKKINVNCDTSMRSYYNALINNFIVIDKEQVDLFWYKYHCGEYSLAENPTYSSDRQKARFYSRDWLSGQVYGIDIFILDDSIMDRIEN